MIELQGIQKYFPANGVNALDTVDFSLRPGEIHALLGENGAGKSTLTHIMAGYLRPGGGRILLNGKEARFSAPADALAAGIGMVRQYPNLTGGFRVWEDCVIGAEPRRALFLDSRKARNMAAALSERWDFGLDVDAGTDSLTVSQRQKAAVLALLVRNADYLIFDEPTAVLSPGETGALFALFRSLKAEGKGVVLISHKLDETLGIACRVTVLRKGRTVATRDAAALSGESLRALMFGHGEADAAIGLESSGIAPDSRLRKTETRSCRGDQSGKGPVLFSVQNLSVELPGRPFIRGISLEIAGGTILGVAGVRDSGLETLELAVTGLLRPSAGRISLQGQDITGGGIRAFRKAGGGYLGAGRTGSALAPALPLRDSMIIHAHRRARRGVLGRLGIMDQGGLDSWAGRIMERAGIRASPWARADSFSGGMLRRLTLAREFAEHSSLLVVAEPGWGLDGLSRARLTDKLREFAGRGGAVLLFSTDIDELLSVADGVLALRNGICGDRIELSGMDAADNLAIWERIARAMVGGAGADHG